MKALLWISVGVMVFVAAILLPKAVPEILLLPAAFKAVIGLTFVFLALECIIHGLINKTGPQKC